jgi:hypothetical protein
MKKIFVMIAVAGMFAFVSSSAIAAVTNNHSIVLKGGDDKDKKKDCGKKCDKKCCKKGAEDKKAADQPK